MVNSKLLFIGYIVGIILLFFYSFTQIDLSLTLSQASFVQEFEKSFQHIGYFNRPLATYLFISIIFIVSLFYCLILLKIKEVSKKQLWGVLLFTAILLSIAYNAFSYDLFNYIFDAKIVTYYQQNPYEHKALDYPQDPMLSFMRWTHRLYPYGPVWLGMTIPLSFMGLQYFLPTFFLFKALMTISYLACCFTIYKIMEIVDKKNQIFATAFFAFNPLVIIESLVSAHNDIVMMALLLLSILLLLRNNFIGSIILLSLSIGLKFATVFFVPTYLLLLLNYVHKRVTAFDKAILIGVFCMVGAIVTASIRTNFQPWYLLFVLPLCAIIVQKKIILIPSIICSIVVLFEYVPFLYTGNWDNPIPTILGYITAFSVLLSFVGVILYLAKHKFNLRVIQ